MTLKPQLTWTLLTLVIVIQDVPTEPITITPGIPLVNFLCEVVCR
jgi:hypothetical protein